MMSPPRSLAATGADLSRCGRGVLRCFVIDLSQDSILSVIDRLSCPELDMILACLLTTAIESQSVCQWRSKNQPVGRTRRCTSSWWATTSALLASWPLRHAAFALRRDITAREERIKRVERSRMGIVAAGDASAMSPTRSPCSVHCRVFSLSRRRWRYWTTTRA
jgi:hypothetical protein